MMNIKELKEKLNEGIVEITFTKKNGDERTMKATLQEELIADVGESKRKHEDNLLVVTDIEIGAWRSFNYDQITNIKDNV